MEHFSLIVDIVIIVLLLATIISAYILNQKIKAVRSARNDMEKLFEDFKAISQKLETDLSVVKNTAKDAGEDLDLKISKSKKLVDDLKYINETAEARAGKLELLLAQSARLLKARNEVETPPEPKKTTGEAAKPTTQRKTIRKRSKVLKAPAGKAETKNTEEDVALTKSSEELRQSIEDLQ